ncbi:GNAT family N-acetyltransferase [Mucilaginibacter sp. AW1-3]
MLNLNFKPFPKIETERLTLRQLDIADAADLYPIRTHPVVLRYTNMAVHQNVAQTEAFIKLILANEAAGEAVLWAITLKNEPALIGTICFWNIEPEKDRAEIGYILQPDLHGRGLMGEAVSAVIDYGFEVMKLQTIIADLHEENETSVRLLKRRYFVKQSDSEYGTAIYILNRN